MKTYARIVDDVVVEVIEPFFDDEGKEVPLDQRFTPEVAALFLEYDPQNPPAPPPPPAPVVPSQVTMRQARLALLAAQQLHLVTAAIAQLPSPQKEAAEIEWEFAATVDRGSPTVALLASALSLDEAQLDALFVQAAAL